MKVLVIGIGGLGGFVVRTLVEEGVMVEMYTRDKRKYEVYQCGLCYGLNSLHDATQPDIVFITANQYTPEDRYSYMQKVYGTESFLDCRDDEVTKNGEVISQIGKQLQHLDEVPVIITANPAMYLVGIFRGILGRDTVYGMMSMLDNKRIADYVGVCQTNIVSMGEHGRPVPVIEHLGLSLERKVYDDIEGVLDAILFIAYTGKGIPNYEAPFL